MLKSSSKYLSRFKEIPFPSEPKQHLVRRGKVNYQQAVEYCEKQFSQGESIERLVGFLKIQGFDVISSIKILRESAKIPLADAKRIVVSNPVWEEWP